MNHCLLYRPFSFGHWIVCYIGLFLLAIGLFVPHRVIASDYHLSIFKHFLESDYDNQNVVIEYKLCL